MKVKIKNNVLHTKKVRIATLGPTGTCSERSAEYYAKKLMLNYTTILCNSFEEAINMLINNYVDFVIVPSAYRELARLVFEYIDVIEISDAFLFSTPGLVIATSNKDYNDKKINTIATHSSPKYLAQKYFPKAKLVFCTSNSASALYVVNGKVDACITTKICVEMNNLHIIKDFGEVSMGWNVFVKKNKEQKNENN